MLKIFSLVAAIFSLSTSFAIESSFWENNIPYHNPNLDNQISFIVTRSIKDGALKSELLQKLKAYFKIESFVESGTYNGDTTYVAGLLFNEVHTVELSADLARNAALRLKNLPSVAVHHGDSGSVFNTILPLITSKTCFYLDGHYSGGKTVKGNVTTPIMAELAAIRDAKKTDSVIIIDDLRLFQKTLYPNKINNTAADGYPSLESLVAAILEINPDYQFCCVADALIVFPKEDSVSASPTVNACTLHRLAAVIDGCPESYLSQSDKTIGRVSGEEKSEMISYYEIYSPYEIESGFRSYGALWYGLILIKEGYIHKGVTLIQRTAQNSLKGWRADQFYAP